MYSIARTKRRASQRILRLEHLEKREVLSTSVPHVVDVEVASTTWSAEFADYILNNADFVRDQDSIWKGYSIPTGSTGQMKSLTWTGIDQVMIRFDADVDVDEADLSISGVNRTVYTFSDFHYDPIAFVAIWTLQAPFDKDRIQLDLDANGLDPVRIPNGNLLDGEWTNSVSRVSGDGTPGGDFQFLFHVQPTDVDNNGKITSADASMIGSSIGLSTTSPGYVAARDIDGDGQITTIDRQEAVNRYLEKRPLGNPIGTVNDAPTTSELDRIEITNDAIDVAISLIADFGDAEAGGSGLVYTIVSNSNPSLFDSASINPSSKSLVLNATASALGRASIVIRATDAAGLICDAVIAVDVNRQNLSPEIVEFEVENVGIDTWVVWGRVTDPDDDVSNFLVTFTGVFDIRSAVDEDGRFYFSVIIDEADWGDEFAQAVDPHGAVSPVVRRSVWLT